MRQVIAESPGSLTQQKAARHSTGSIRSSGMSGANSFLGALTTVLEAAVDTAQHSQQGDAATAGGPHSGLCALSGAVTAVPSHIPQQRIHGGSCCCEVSLGTGGVGEAPSSPRKKGNRDKERGPQATLVPGRQSLHSFLERIMVRRQSLVRHLDKLWWTTVGRQKKESQEAKRF